MRKKWTAKFHAESVANAHSYFHFVKQLKSGKQAHLWLFRGGNQNTWHIGAIIADNPKQARLWFCGNSTRDAITGTVSIEGLQWFRKMTIEFAQAMPAGNVLSIEGSDDRRSSLYAHMFNNYFERHDIELNGTVRCWFPDTQTENP